MYLYRHIRLDKNEVFYIGIGSDIKGKYSRARSKHNRNKHWKNIVNKCDYIIEIVLDNLSKEEAFKKEKEFIALYGRKDLKLGTLVNLTDGGDGTYGIKHFLTDEQKKAKGHILTEEHKKILSEVNIGNTHRVGKKLSKEHINKIVTANTGRIPWNKGKTGVKGGVKKGNIPWNKGKSKIKST